MVIFLQWIIAGRMAIHAAGTVRIFAMPTNIARDRAAQSAIFENDPGKRN
jgi:hypothetical protein